MLNHIIRRHRKRLEHRNGSNNLRWRAFRLAMRMSPVTATESEIIARADAIYSGNLVEVFEKKGN